MKVIYRWFTVGVLALLLVLTSLGWTRASGSSASTPTKAWDWETICVECPHAIRGVIDHALQWDAAGHPHLAYGGDQLYHAWHDGTRWQNEVVDPTPGVGEMAALGLDSQGRVHISYYDSLSSSLNYTRWTGTGWERQQLVELGLGRVTDLALVLDKRDRPHIVYSDGDPYSLRFVYVYQNETTWVEESIDSGGRFNTTPISLALDGADRLHLSYSLPGVLVYAVREQAGWAKYSFDGPIGHPSHQSLAVDGQGKVHISYLLGIYESSPTTPSRVELHHIVWDGSGWIDQTVDGSLGALGSTSLLLDGGQPRIGYFDAEGNSLLYARFDGSLWSFQTLAQGVDVLTTLSLGLDGAGKLLMVYRDTFTTTLQAMQEEDATWRADIIDHTGWNRPDALVVDEAERPHLLYHTDEGDLSLLGDDLVYAYLEGQQWVRQQVDEGTGAKGGLVLDAQGHPHVSYCKFDSAAAATDGLIYAFFDGSQWQRQVVGIAKCTDGGSVSDVALDSAGRPHLAYYLDGIVHYATFDGTTWHIQSLAEASGWTQGITLLLDSEDAPHIAYQPAQRSTPGYAHWDGTRWVIHYVDEGATDTSLPSLALDSNDLPHLAYGGRHARWDGQQWLTEQVTTRSDDYPVLLPSLAIDSQGQLHIAYVGGRYLHWDGQQWLTATVSTARAPLIQRLAWEGPIGLALSETNQPHLVYPELGDIRYARPKETFTRYLPIAMH